MIGQNLYLNINYLIKNENNTNNNQSGSYSD